MLANTLSVVRFSAPLVVALSAGVASAQFMTTNLSSNQAGVGTNQEANLTNGWGLASGTTGNIFVSSAGGSSALQFNGLGATQPGTIAIPGSTAGSQGTPTGVVFGGNSGFTVNGSTANFLWGTTGGTIAGWNNGGTATTLVNNSAAGASYTGVALSGAGSNSLFYATDFANGRVSTFDNTFNPVNSATFTDPTLPAGYSPFNVRTFGDRVYVTYALRDQTTGEEVAGNGNGLIDVYTTSGDFVQRLSTGGALNAPWGMAMAPSNFGNFSNALLVGNFGDGTINAYEPTTGAFLGTLMDQNSNPIVVDGLWGIDFGNGGANQAGNTLFFAAGPDDEANGVFGQIQLVPTPGAISLLGLVGLRTLRKRR